MSSEHASSATPAAHHDGAGHHDDSYYIKTWGILLGLLVVSVVGPFLGIGWLTLVTAFGIAIVKAVIVARRFMHLNTEKRYVSFMFLSMLVFMAMFFFGTSPDVLKHEGQRWNNVAAKAAEQRAINAKLEPHHVEKHE